MIFQPMRKFSVHPPVEKSLFNLIPFLGDRGTHRRGLGCQWRQHGFSEVFSENRIDDSIVADDLWFRMLLSHELKIAQPAEGVKRILQNMPLRAL